MKAEIISSGEELVLGATVDTNSAWLSVRLSEMGIPVLRHVAVGDELADIVGALREACGRAEVVILTGGLGPTADDLAREAMSELTGRPLVSDPVSLQQIRDRFARMGRVMPAENAVQALHPEGSEPIPNAKGTAPGIHSVVETAGRRSDVFVMPGVPREMYAMFDGWVAPRLSRPGARGRAMAIGSVNCFGMGESVIGERIRHLMTRGRNPSVGTNVKDLVVKVRATFRGESPDAACQAVAAELAELRNLLGEIVFGENDDTLEVAVGRLLIAKNRTAAVAEDLTGGLIGALLANVPGIGEHFREGIVARTAAAKMSLLAVPEATLQRHGAVSAETAEAMAAGCRTRSQADLCVSVVGTTGTEVGPEAKPGEGSAGVAYLGFADAGGVGHVRVPLLGDPDQIRDRAAKHALNLLRLKLLKADPPAI